MSNVERSNNIPMSTFDDPLTIVIGENLVDLLIAENGDVTAVPGGGPFNVARTIARLGQSAILLTRISSDAFGKVIRDILERDHVGLWFDSAVELPTALAVVDVSSDSPRYAFHLRDTAAFAITGHEGVNAFRTVPSPFALYVGTLGLIVEPMATMVEDVVTAAPASTIVILDPNCRPSATPDENSYRNRIGRLLPRCDIVKASTEDLEFLFPRMTKEAAANKLLESGVAIVIVTDGPRAVHAYSAADVVTIDVPIRQIEDTVGAGDALIGGLLAWCAARRITRDDARSLSVISRGLGVAVDIASITCSRTGAEPPWHWEIKSNNETWFE